MNHRLDHYTSYLNVQILPQSKRAKNMINNSKEIQIGNKLPQH